MLVLSIQRLTPFFLLGAAGILSGVNATTHWAALDRLNRWGAVPVQERIVESGKIITAAGVSAGIDMALILAAKIAGENVAKKKGSSIELTILPSFQASKLPSFQASKLPSFHIILSQ